ncbi:MAG: terpene cyclase/mutase family protein [Firmicutes bacterium]|nr:terpene cyclase/mutase family protein [Bacillota bacterium]
MEIKIPNLTGILTSIASFEYTILKIHQNMGVIVHTITAQQQPVEIDLMPFHYLSTIVETTFGSAAVVVGALIGHYTQKGISNYFKKRKEQPSRVLKRTIKSNKKNATKSIDKATKFVFDNRKKDGLWYDFSSKHHGESSYWISSFVGLNLLDLDPWNIRIKDTAKELVKYQEKDGGFSYSNLASSDSDSTAFAIRFLSEFGYEQEVYKAKKFLDKHQNSDSGFGTYLEEKVRKDYDSRIPKEESLDGWISSTADITTSALLANPDNKKAVKFLLDSQQEDGRWRSYWWNNDIYATVHAIEVLSKLGYKSQVKKAGDWLSKEENISDIPFYLALATQGMIRSEESYDKINSCVEELLSSQRKDGSWNSYDILRFPSHSNTEPWVNKSRWREDAKDQNRLLTTSTCIRALSDYKTIDNNIF